MSTSLTINRVASGLAITNLVIGTTFASGSLYLPEDGLTRPDMDYRRGYAPDSSYVPGRTLLAAVLEASTLPVTIYARAASTSALRTLEATLTAALAQWAYDVTLTVDGQSETWTGEPTRPAFGPVDSGMVRAFISRAALTIPINPQ